VWNIPQLISLAAGLDFDKDKLWKVFQRNRNLVRALNVRRGMRRRDEAPPADHWAKRDPEYEQKLLDAYYAFKGWNKEGIPTRETLAELGMDYVGKELEQRGILTK
jgi:aldehyde:ferredoxin oxidoreductase